MRRGSLSPLALGATLALSLAACASAQKPDPIAGDSIDHVASVRGIRLRRPAFALSTTEHALSLYGVNAEGSPHDYGEKMLVFEDGRYVCKLDAEPALEFSSCLAQPAGRALLAERVRALCAGNPDPLAQPIEGGGSTIGEARCPRGHGLADPLNNRPEWQDKYPLLSGLASVVMISAALILSPVLIPAGFTYLGVARLHDRPLLSAQEKLRVGTSEPEVGVLTGEATATFYLEPAHTEVRYFERWDARPLWLGLENGELVWVRFVAMDPWLVAVAERERSAAEASRQ